MNTLKIIWLAFLRLVKQVRSLPQTIAHAADQRRRQTALEKSEVERLDRICHPEKYRGR